MKIESKHKTIKHFSEISKDRINSDILKVEKKLRVKFKEDFIINYLNNPQMSQRKFSDRWETKRNVIWYGDKRTNTPSWLEVLGLNNINKIHEEKLEIIELCQDVELNSDNDQLLSIEEFNHKIPNSILNSTSKSGNILNFKYI
jgi:hypothetical protein